MFFECLKGGVILELIRFFLFWIVLEVIVEYCVICVKFMKRFYEDCDGVVVVLYCVVFNNCEIFNV